MKKNKFLSSLLLGCAAFAVAGGVAGWKTANVSANNSQSSIEEPTTFAAIQGAQVRKTVGTSGIRFSTIVNDEWWGTETSGKTVEYGYLVAKNAAEELTEQNATKVPAQVMLEVDANEDGTTDYLRFNYAITNIPETEYETLVSARPYITIDGTTQYGTTQTRSIAKVAASAFAASEADPDGVIAGYVNEVAEDVSFAAETQKLNKAVITVDTAGLAVETQPAGYAVKLTSNNEDVAKIVNGKIVPQAKEGKATITAQFGTQQSATYELTVVSYSATLGGKAIADDALLTVNVADNYFASITNPYTAQGGVSSVATQASSAADKLVVKEFDGTNETDVTSAVDYAYTVEGVATVDDGTVTGGTVNGTTTVSAKVDGYEVANFDVEGWTEITTIAQMNELSLVTWRQRDSEATVRAVLGGKYKLGANLAYNGDYILPIANTTKFVSNTVGTDINNDGDLTNDAAIFNGDSAYTSYHSWVWKDILSVIEPVADGEEAGTWKEYWGKEIPGGEWTSAAYNNAFLHGSNPLGLSFTGVFDGNGYTISDAQIVYVNYLYINGGTHRSTPAGGCFIGVLGEDGVLKNVNFEDLRWQKHYGNTKAEIEAQLSAVTYPDTCVWFPSGNDTGTDHTGGKQYVRYGNTVTINSQSGLVVVNQGLISDVRMSSYYRSAPARYTNNVLSANNKNHAFGAVVNDSTGVINNFVFELLNGAIEYLRAPDYVEGSGEDWHSGLINGDEYANNIFYSRNYGTVKNSIFLSNVTDGKEVRRSPTNSNKSYHAASWIAAYGNVALDEGGKYKQTINAGTVTNCGGYFEDWLDSTTIMDIFNAGTVYGTTTFPATHVELGSYSTELWDLSTLSFKTK